MPDREKVIGELETLTMCGRYDALVIVIAREALALLREQEPVPFDEIGYQPVCGACHESLDVTDEYCRHCGRKVKWKHD